MKKSIFLAMVVLLLLSPCGCSAGGPWKARVIDAETKQPIEGAAVVAVWEKEMSTPAGTASNLLAAEETATNKDGVFEIPAKSFISIPGIRGVRGPFFTIFKPSYGSFPRYQVNIKAQNLTPADYFETKGAVVELPRFMTKEDRFNSLHAAELDLDYFRKAKLRNIIKIISEENNNLGLTGYRE